MGHLFYWKWEGFTTDTCGTNVTEKIPSKIIKPQIWKLE